MQFADSGGLCLEGIVLRLAATSASTARCPGPDRQMSWSDRRTGNSGRSRFPFVRQSPIACRNHPILALVAQGNSTGTDARSSSNPWAIWCNPSTIHRLSGGIPPFGFLYRRLHATGLGPPGKMPGKYRGSHRTNEQTSRHQVGIKMAPSRVYARVW